MYVYILLTDWKKYKIIWINVVQFKKSWVFLLHDVGKSVTAQNYLAPYSQSELIESSLSVHRYFYACICSSVIKAVLDCFGFPSFSGPFSSLQYAIPTTGPSSSFLFIANTEPSLFKGHRLENELPSLRKRARILWSKFIVKSHLYSSIAQFLLHSSGWISPST